MVECEENKLFVGGLPEKASVDTLRDHFDKYGDVLWCFVAIDFNTRISRGFGFVSFSESSAVHKALQDTHVILGRTVDVKKALPRSEQQQNRGLNKNSRGNGRSNGLYRSKKIFVGGLSPSLTEKEFKSYFDKFGNITDVVVMHDNATKRPRGFGFITFDSEDAVEDVMQNNFHELSGKSVEVKRAIPKDVNNNGNDAMRVDSGRGLTFNYQCYSPYIYPPFSGYGYGGVAGFAYGTNFFGGWYPVWIDYGVPPVVPWSLWNHHGS